MEVFNTYILLHIVYTNPVWSQFFLAKDQKRLRAMLHHCDIMFSLNFNTLIQHKNSTISTISDFKRRALIGQNDDKHPLHRELNLHLIKRLTIT